MPKKGARASKPSSSATKAKVVKGMTKKKERSSKRKPRARSPRDDAPAAGATTRSFPGPTANQLASAPGEIASDASSGPLGTSARVSASDKETPAGGANCASPGPTTSSSPASAAKEKAPASRSSTGQPKTKQPTSTHAEKAPACNASLRARKPIDYIFAAQGIAKDDASDEDYDPECDPDDDLEEIPRTVRTAVQRETLGPVVGSGPDTGGSAKNNTNKPKEVDVDARSKRDGKQHVTGFEASMRRFVQAARVEAEEAASSHKAAQDDTETVSGQVNVEIIDDDAEPIVESNAVEGNTSSLDADSHTQHNDAVNDENNNEITSLMLLCMLLYMLLRMLLLNGLPPEMTNNFKRMWCTHGASRESRGEGRRDYDSQFTGCEAGFLVRSERAVVDGQAKWQVSVAPGSEISLHNHKTNKLIYDSYHGAKSMLLTPQARQELGLLTEMKASTADITRYLSDKLGGCYY
ncbi:hypothetical protein PC113_g17236 [Phytophthora cactorum]|uniref:Uncharacterized protein n=1 Tax=Phytophthora cactorum TaxID=29920 RepID=A0A8T0YR83_9STRA|nr:hypothetical protein PC113_g17236 [Phytophthora cactorum]